MPTQTQKCYRYNEKTKEYIGEDIAYLDPLQYKIKGTTQYNLPANCTFDVPNINPEEGYTIVYNNGWQKISDYRGKYYYDNEGIKKVDFIGEPSEGQHLISDEMMQLIDERKYIYKDGEIVEYVPTNEELIQQKEEEIDVLNSKLIRDMRVLQDDNASQEDKAQAQTYFNNKISQINSLIEEINELKEEE